MNEVIVKGTKYQIIRLIEHATENYHPRFRLTDHAAHWPPCARA